MFLSAHDHASSVIIIYLRIYEHVYHSVQMGCRIWDDAAHLSHVPMIWINNLFNEFECECGWMSRYFLFWNPFPFHMHIFLFSFFFRLLLLLFNRSRYDAVLEAYWKSSRVKKKLLNLLCFCVCILVSVCGAHIINYYSGNLCRIIIIFYLQCCYFLFFILARRNLVPYMLIQRATEEQFMRALFFAYSLPSNCSEAANSEKKWQFFFLFDKLALVKPLFFVVWKF